MSSVLKKFARTNVLEQWVPRLKIVNLLVTTELKQTVRLEKLVCVKGFLYDSTTYQFAHLKDQNTHGKVSIFSSGKLISVGAKSYKDAKHDLSYAASRLAKLNLAKRTRLIPKLQNIVASGDVGVPIDIEKLSKLPRVIYDPEQFPGAIYYAEELQGASILIFANGKVVVAGMKNEGSIELAKAVLAKLEKILTESA